MLTLIYRFIFGTPDNKVVHLDPHSLRNTVSRLNKERNDLRRINDLLRTEIELTNQIHAMR